MAKIQHIALACKDHEAVAEFYKKVFGMVEVDRRPDKRDPNVHHISLSDGNIRLSLVPDIVGYPEGLNHIGFQVEDRDKTADTAIAMGAKSGDDKPRGPDTEVVIIDLTGTRVDIRNGGWGQASADDLETAAQELARA
jgi:catechol 2,3-dioxygenase-like lactoylglutathione lyase family enzyme